MSEGTQSGVTDQFKKAGENAIGSIFDQNDAHLKESVENRITELLGEGDPELANQMLREFISGQLSTEMQGLLDKMGPEASGKLMETMVEGTKNAIVAYSTQEEKRSDAVRDASAQSQANINNLLLQQNQVEMNAVTMKGTVLNFMGAVGEVLSAVGPMLGLSPEITAAAGTWMDKAIEYGQQVGSDQNLVNKDMLAYDVDRHFNETAYNPDQVTDVVADVAQEGVLDAGDTQEVAQNEYDAHMDEVAQGSSLPSSGKSGAQITIDAPGL